MIVYTKSLTLPDRHQFLDMPGLVPHEAEEPRVPSCHAERLVTFSRLVVRHGPNRCRYSDALTHLRGVIQF